MAKSKATVTTTVKRMRGSLPQVQNIDKLTAFSAEELAKNILAIAKAMKVLTESPLKRDAIVALIADKSKLGKGTIEVVLNNLDSLEETWLKKKL